MVKKFDDPLSAMKAVSELRHRTKVVNLDDNFKITLRTLGTKKETDTFINCMHLWGQAFIYKHKIETLIHAIIQINDVQIDVDEDAKRSLIELWSQDVIDELYLEYATMIGSVESYLKKIQLTAETNVVGAKDAEAKQNEIKIDSTEGDENVK